MDEESTEGINQVKHEAELDEEYFVTAAEFYYIRKV